MAEPQDLITAARCFSCLPPGAQRSVLVYVFNQIRILQGGNVMTVQELMDASKCYRGCVSQGMEGAALLYLAQGIVDNGAASSNFTYTRSAVDPVAAPPTLYGQHYNTVSQVLWQWDGAAWV